MTQNTAAFQRTKREVFKRTVSGLWAHTDKTRDVFLLLSLLPNAGLIVLGLSAKPGSFDPTSLVPVVFAAAAAAGTAFGLPRAVSLLRQHGPGPLVKGTNVTAWEMEDRFKAYLHTPMETDSSDASLNDLVKGVSFRWHEHENKATQDIRNRLARLTAEAIEADLKKPLHESSPDVMYQAANASLTEEFHFVLDQTPLETQRKWLDRELQRENSPFFALSRTATYSKQHVSSGASLSSPYLGLVRTFFSFPFPSSPLFGAIRNVSPELMFQRAILDRVSDLVALNARDMAESRPEKQKGASCAQANMLARLAMHPFGEKAEPRSEGAKRAVLAAKTAHRQVQALAAG